MRTCCLTWARKGEPIGRRNCGCSLILLPLLHEWNGCQMGETSHCSSFCGITEGGLLGLTSRSLSGRRFSDRTMRAAVGVQWAAVLDHWLPGQELSQLALDDGLTDLRLRVCSIRSDSASYLAKILTDVDIRPAQVKVITTASATRTGAGSLVFSLL